MPDYKSNKLKEFKRAVNNTLRKHYSDKDEYEHKRDQINAIIADYGLKFNGELFFIVANELQVNIGDFCEQLFSDYTYETLCNTNQQTDKLNIFISFFTNSERSLADAAGIDKGRLNRVKNNSNEDLFAYEVYGLAKSLGLCPEALFQYLYGEQEWTFSITLK
ncbi:MAG: hypothetical protein LBE37_09840 [Sphingobacterium sp.]|jgi:hypothetical protein|nr:hypothetical protein [Sphingobacterium sp.]